jgi:hypothetical protein
MSVPSLVCTTAPMPQPLLSDGAKLYDRQAQLRIIIRRRLGERHSRLLAEPRATAEGCDWLSPETGLVRPLAALPAAVRASVQAECTALLADITRLGTELGSATTTDGRLAGQLLRQVAIYPSDEHLFLVGNQPVLAAWGCDATQAGAVVPPRRRAVPATSASMPAAAPIPPAPRWLLSAV